MLKIGTVLLSCIALAVAGCGNTNGEEEPETGAAATEQQTTETGGGAAAAGGKTVTMKDIQFDPKTLTVKKGDRVRWTNDDSVGHDVTKTGGPGPAFKSGEPGGMQQGDTFSHTFNTAGTIKYVCSVHSGMEGTVTVR